MKMNAITGETRLLCRNHIDTAEQLQAYQGTLQTEANQLLLKRKGLYAKSRKLKLPDDAQEKETVKSELSDISKRLSAIRKEQKLCIGIASRSGVIKENLQTIQTDEREQKRKELMKYEPRGRCSRASRENEPRGV